MWAAGVSYDVAGKGFDPTVGKITKCDGGTGHGVFFSIEAMGFKRSDRDR